MNKTPTSNVASEPSSAVPADTVVHKSALQQGNGGSFLTLRRPVPHWLSILLGLLCIVAVLAVWWFVTRGVSEERLLPYHKLPSPAETFDKEKLSNLWFERALTRNLLASLRRVVLGFSLAAAVGIPLGILSGCFPWVNSFLAPINVFGRNIPIAGLIFLTFSLFGIEEFQKVMFIFIATVAFVMMDTATAISDVSSRYIDTAYTLGASRWQIIRKVLVPLAMPRVFNSLRLLFGLAFGYIMLAELVTIGGAAGGLGNIISVAGRLGNRETILLVMFVIPAVALAVDRLLYAVQRSLFPYQYASGGLLHNAWRGMMHAAEGLKHKIVAPQPLGPAQQAALAATKSSHDSPVAKSST